MGELFEIVEEKSPDDRRELREILRLLREILARLPAPTYPQPTGGSVTVRS